MRDRAEMVWNMGAFSYRSWEKTAAHMAGGDEATKAYQRLLKAKSPGRPFLGVESPGCAEAVDAELRRLASS